MQDTLFANLCGEQLREVPSARKQGRREFGTDISGKNEAGSRNDNDALVEADKVQIES